MADLKRRIIAVFSAQNKAKGVMAGFGRNMDTVGRTMRRMAVGALAVAGVGGLGYMLKKQMETIDATAKLSDRLGMSTEALIGMQHGANIAGVETEALNKALSTLSSRLGEVDMGVGQATYALEKLGLNYKDLIGLDMDVAIGIVADQIRSLSTQSEKAAAANYLFGKSGKQLLNLFEEGSAGVAKYQEEVRKLGLSFSRIDAAQVEAANDALTRARAVMTGLFRTATIELAPYIGALADKFVDVATAGEGVGANVVNAFESISLSIVNTAEEVERLVQKLAALTSPVDYMKKMTKGTEEAWKRYRQETGETKAGRYTLGPLYAPVQPKDKALFDRILAEERAGVGIEIVSRESKIRDAFENIRKKAAGKPDFMTTFPEVMRFEQEPFSWEKVPQEITEEHRRAAREVDKAWTEMWLKQEETAYHAMRAPIIEAEEAAKESEERRIELAENTALRRQRIAEDVAMSMARSWTSAVDKMFFEGMRFWDAMTDMARGLAREIANIIIYKKLAEPFAYGIMGLPIPGGGGGGMPGPMPGQSIAPSGTPFWPGGSLQHGGEVLETGLAKVHKGEKYSGVGGGKLEVNVTYKGDERPVVEEAEFDFKQQVLNITMQAAATDGAFRRSIKQATR